MNYADRRVKRGWMNLKVTNVVNETWDTKTFYLEDLEESGRNWDYYAGQYLTFRFDDIAEKPIVRSYTMSSSPNDPKSCAITVKRVEKGIISNWLCDKVEVGSVLRARGPIGKFIYEPGKDQPHLIMIAAGSGVTPFISIMREFAQRLGEPEAPAKMTLLVAFRSQKDLILKDTLDFLAAQSNVSVHITLSRDPDAPDRFWKGRISNSAIARATGGVYSGCTFMTCGPQEMMTEAKSFVLQNGVTPENFKLESFES
jgi:ferredoxin-NADP reductase